MVFLKEGSPSTGSSVISVYSLEVLYCRNSKNILPWQSSWISFENWHVLHPFPSSPGYLEKAHCSSHSNDEHRRRLLSGIMAGFLFPPVPALVMRTTYTDWIFNKADSAFSLHRQTVILPWYSWLYEWVLKCLFAQFSHISDYIPDCPMWSRILLQRLKMLLCPTALHCSLVHIDYCASAGCQCMKKWFSGPQIKINYKLQVNKPFVREKAQSFCSFKGDPLNQNSCDLLYMTSKMPHFVIKYWCCLVGLMNRLYLTRDSIVHSI